MHTLTNKIIYYLHLLTFIVIVLVTLVEEINP